MLQVNPIPSTEDINALSDSKDLQILLKAVESILSHEDFHLKMNEKSHIDLLDKKIQIQMKLLDKDEEAKKVSRGGNNVAENIKKALIATMKKRLPVQIYREMQETFIIPFHMKSQKENLVLFFLFLTVLVQQKKLERGIIERLREEIHHKIEKYISNSNKKMSLEAQDRREFHMKNIKEFQKFMNLDLDFFKERSFQQMSNQIEKLYLRKKMEFQKAEERLKLIIRQYPCLVDIFADLKGNDSTSMASEDCPAVLQQHQ